MTRTLVVLRGHKCPLCGREDSHVCYTAPNYDFVTFCFVMLLVFVVVVMSM
jgi:hypothetical protein